MTCYMFTLSFDKPKESIEVIKAFFPEHEVIDSRGDGLIHINGKPVLLIDIPVASAPVPHTVCMVSEEVVKPCEQIFFIAHEENKQSYHIMGYMSSGDFKKKCRVSPVGTVVSGQEIKEKGWYVFLSDLNTKFLAK